jgi:GxxExxY protein
MISPSRQLGQHLNAYNVLGYSFLEKVYQRAMIVELAIRGLRAEDERPIKVYFKGSIVGEYEADLFVEECVIVELKIAKEYQTSDEAQLLNELKATGVRVGLLINFGKSKSRIQAICVLKHLQTANDLSSFGKDFSYRQRLMSQRRTSL